MRDILTAPWMVEMIRTVTNMYDHGRNERNGGNVSLLLEEPQVAPEVNLGLVRLTNGGETAQLLWGYADGSKFISEFPAHMMSHAERLKVDLT